MTTTEHPAPDLRQAAVQAREALEHIRNASNVSYIRRPAREALASLDAALAAHPVQEQAGQMMSDEREAFMEWVSDRGCDTDGAWSAWQARALLSASPAQQDAPKGAPVAWLREEYNGTGMRSVQLEPPPAELSLRETAIGVRYTPLVLATPPKADAPIGEPTEPPVAWRWSESGGKHWFDWTTDWTHHDKAKRMGFPIQYATPIAAPAGQPAAWSDVLAERKRQQEVEGWTPEHDDEHNNGEMARAAAVYALYDLGVPGSVGFDNGMGPLWPWDWGWFKPKDNRRNLIRAAALLLAEIERLDRAAAPSAGQPATSSEAAPAPVVADRIYELWRQALAEGPEATTPVRFARALLAAPSADRAAPVGQPAAQAVEVAETPRFQWCCDNGCGPCDVKRIEYEYSRSEDLAGNLLESKTEPRLVSKCCGAGLTMFDNLLGEEVAIGGSHG